MHIRIPLSYNRRSGIATADSAKIFAKGRGFKYGDINGNYILTPADASLVLQHVIGTISIPGSAFVQADVTGNGTISAFDAAYILRYSAGLISVFPIGLPKTTRGETVSGLISCVRNYDKDKGILSIMLSSAESQNIYAIQFSAYHGRLEYQRMENNIDAEGIMTAIESRNGVLTFSIAADYPLPSQFTFVTLYFNVPGDNAVDDILFRELFINEMQYDVSLLNQESVIPKEYSISQNYPNPFNPITSILYQIPDESNVTLTIYNILGQRVRTLVDSKQTAGYYSLTWDGTDESGVPVASGVYFYRIRAGSFIKAKKMLFLK